MSLTASASLKEQAQAFLKQIGLYERFKASRVYDFYWSYADPHWITDRAKEVEFYRTVLSGLRKRDVIFDIGANDGCKTDVFLRLGAKVVAVEPDESNLEIIKGKFLKNRFFPKPVTIEDKAVSDWCGKMPMFVEGPGSALNTLSPKWADRLRNDETRFGQHFSFATKKIVETTTLESLIARHGRPYYIKIDVEGHELNVLRGLKQAVPYLSFEVNLPEFKEEGLKCIDLLHHIAPNGEFNYAADCRVGLRLQSWIRRRDFISIFEQSQEPMIEIFWRHPGCGLKNSRS
jgi:FkbM family methyltransferase